MMKYSDYNSTQFMLLHPAGPFDSAFRLRDLASYLLFMDTEGQDATGHYTAFMYMFSFF